MGLEAETPLRMRQAIVECGTSVSRRFVRGRGIEGLQKEVDGLTKQQDQQRKALEDYLGNLNVG